MQGFQNLYTLEKGVQNYMKQKGTDLWKGSLFVFDGRMAVRPGAPHTPFNYGLSNLYSGACAAIIQDDPMTVLCCMGARGLHPCFGRSFIEKESMQRCFCGSVSVGIVMLLRLWKHAPCTQDQQHTCNFAQATRMAQPLGVYPRPPAVRCAEGRRSCRTSTAPTSTATSSSWLAPLAR